MLLSLLIVLISVSLVAAQPGDIPVFKQVSHPFFPPITSQYFFFSLDGIMWFSTARGLTSFDGSEVIFHSSTQESNDFGLSRINCMTEDKEHNFYIGTGISLLYYNRRTNQFTKTGYTFKDDQSTPEIGSISMYLDTDGILYSGAGLRGLFVYDPVHKRMEHYNLDSAKQDSWTDRWHNTVSSFVTHASDRNKLWVGTYQGLYLFDKKKKKFEHNFEIATSRKHKFIPTLDTDRQSIEIARMETEGDSLIWFNSWAGGFGQYNTRTGKANIVFGLDALYKAKDLYYGYTIAGFLKLPDGKFLIGVTNAKTAVYDARTDSAVYFNISGIDYQHEQTRYMTYDIRGNIWILQKGLLYVSIPESRRLKTLKVPEPAGFQFGSPKLKGVFYDSSSQLYYACFQASNGVHVFDSRLEQKKLLPTSAVNNFYNYGTSVDAKIAKDGSGRFWTVGWKSHVLLPGEPKFDLVENKFPTLSWFGKEDRFYDIVATREGHLLFRQSGGLVYLVNHTTLKADTIRYKGTGEQGAEIKESSSWYDKKRNFIYFIQGGSIGQYAPDKKEMRILPHAALFGNLPSNQGVCAPALDAAGRLWLMIPRYGIRIIDPMTLQCIDSFQYGQRGLIHGGYTAMLGGSDQFMLFRSQNGVVVYDYARQESFLFDRSNGLSSPENSSFQFCNGYLFIGQADRIEYYKLENLKGYSSAITAQLNSITTDTTTVFIRTGLEDHSVKLKYYQNTLTFSFSAAEFIFPERIDYAYRLLPLDRDWRYTNYFNRKIIYSQLEPGTYTFQLKAQMLGGNWESSINEYQVTITPAWWQTFLFRLFLFLLFVLLLSYIIQKGIQSIRNKEKLKTLHEKEMLELEALALRAQMNPHFIFNSLNSIKSLINKNENETAAGYLTTFSKMIRTLFHHSDKREISLWEELETCRLYAELENMRFGEKVQFVFDVDDSLDLKDIKVPALVLQPFIENSIWHGLVPKETGGKVIISVKGQQSAVECVVDDNGIGRELSEKYKTEYRSGHQSKGIGLTQARLELDKMLNNREDSIRIIDKKHADGSPAGTTVIIRFAHP